VCQKREGETLPRPFLALHLRVLQVVNGATDVFHVAALVDWGQTTYAKLHHVRGSPSCPASCSAARTLMSPAYYEPCLSVGYLIVGAVGGGG
jgi:hypothetical protein